MAHGIAVVLSRRHRGPKATRVIYRQTFWSVVAVNLLALMTWQLCVDSFVVYLQTFRSGHDIVQWLGGGVLAGPVNDLLSCCRRSVLSISSFFLLAYSVPSVVQ